jgi:hypothetical protein
VPPRPKGKKWPWLLIIGLVALCLCGWPLSCAVQLARVEDGPYHSAAQVCDGFNGAAARTVLDGQRVSTTAPLGHSTIGDSIAEGRCYWESADRVRGVALVVDIEERSLYMPAADQAKGRYGRLVGGSGLLAARAQTGVGDEASLIVEENFSSGRSLRVRLVARKGNAVITLSTYTQAALDRKDRYTAAEANAALDQIEPLTAELVDDIVDGLSTE